MKSCFVLNYHQFCSLDLNINNVNKYNGFTSEKGGAIANSGEIIIGNSVTFSSNTATNIYEYGGGAIYNNTDGEIAIEDFVSFSSNTSMLNGGAIYNCGEITIGNSVVFSTNTAVKGSGAAIYNSGEITIGNSVVFSSNVSTSHGGAIVNWIYSRPSLITINDLVVFSSNTSYYGGAISNGSDITISNGARFIDNTALQNGGAIYNSNGTINLIADTNNVEFTGNKADNVSNAIHDNSGTINLWASKNADVIFNDRITSENNTSILNINKSSNTLPTTGKIVLNEDMSGYTGTVNLYGGTLELKTGNKFFNTDNFVNHLGYFITNVNDIDNGFVNNGITEFTGGENNNEITGTGNLIISGETVNNNTIDQNTVTVTNKLTNNNTIAANINNSGTFITNAGNITGNILNNGITEFTGGENNNEISGTGNLLISGETVNNNTINQNTVTVTNKLTNNNIITANMINNSITANITNNGIFNINVDLTINSGITAESLNASNIINLGGNTVISSEIKNQNINVAADKEIKINEGGAIRNSNLIFTDAGILNLKNNQTDNITLNNFSSNGAELKIDVDLSDNTSDNFTVSNAATGTVNITEINIINVLENTGSITIFNNLKSPKLNVFTIANYGGYEYKFTESATCGVLNYEKTDKVKTFKETVNDTSRLIKSYSLSANEEVTENLGQLGGEQLTIFGNGYDINGNSHAGITVSDGQRLNINNVNSYNNFISENGGAVYNNGGTVNIKNGISFLSNTATVQGGAIYNKGIITIGDNVDISTNTTKLGGAVYNDKGTVKIGNNSVFTYNKVTGGDVSAIVNFGDFIIGNNANFNFNESNSSVIFNSSNKNFTIGADAVFSNNTARSKAVIYNIGNFITGSNVKFLNNSGTAIENEGVFTIEDGGLFKNSIENSGVLNITADNNKAEFSDNLTAIFNYSDGILNITAKNNNVEFLNNQTAIDNYGTINLQAGSGASIIFNDKINLDHNSVLNINKESEGIVSTGKIILNGDINGLAGAPSKSINLYNGELHFAENGKIYNADLNLYGGTLNFQNGQIDSITVQNFNSDSANLMIDVDLSAGTSDNFTVDNKVLGTLNITGINIAGVSGDTGSITIFNNLKSPKLNVLTVANYGGYEYTFTESTTKGVLNYQKTGLEKKLKAFINAEEPSNKSYTLTKNEEVTEDLGLLGGEQLTIFGQDYDINGNNNAGVILGSGQILNIKNVNSYNGFISENGGAVYNNGGTLNIENGISFLANTATGKGGAVLNKNGILNITALADGIKFAGNIAGGESNAIHDDGGTINLFTSENADIIFNDRITSENNKSILNINKYAGAAVPGKVELNEDMSGYTGTVNLYDCILELKQGSKFFGTDKFVNHSGYFIANAGDINNNFVNNGVTEFTGGENNNIITGAGEIRVVGDVINNKEIIQNTVTVAESGNLINNSRISSVWSIDVAGSLTNNSEIHSDSLLNISGNLTNNSNIDAQIINISEEGTVITNAYDLYTSDKINNAGQLILKGGMNRNIIKGNGTLSAEGELFSDNIIEQNTVNISGEFYNYSELTADNIYLSGILSNYNTVNTENLYLSGMFKPREEGTLNTANTIIKSGAVIESENYFVNTHNVHLGNLKFESGMLVMNVNADLENKTMDTVSADSSDYNGKIKVNNINVIKDAAEDNVNISFADDTLKSIVYTDIKKVYTPLYKYGVNYNNETGNFNFIRVSGSIINNPVTFENTVANQVGAHLTQITVTDNVFQNIDTQMNIVKQAKNRRVLYASTANTIFEDKKSIEDGLWIRPYTVSEKLTIDGTEINNDSFGTLGGLDLQVADNIMMSFYLGSLSSKQKYEDVIINQSGYGIGLTGSYINENFYASVTGNIVLNGIEAENPFGTDEIKSQMYTVAAKTGFNIQLSSKLSLQPSLLIMYSMINTEDYINSQKQEIKSDPTTNIHIEPSVKAVLSLSHHWKPYIMLSLASNRNSANVTMADIELPEKSIGVYNDFGIGVEKNWLEHWNMYVQMTKRVGARDGFGIFAGVKYRFGNADEEVVRTVEYQKALKEKDKNEKERLARESEEKARLEAEQKAAEEKERRNAEIRKKIEENYN